ncbi:unnamed protein product [Amoebophrya sp. A25]|nr:unnamed protein product [Amoebophrya sp. A25]|eukprot:GSA25T00024198001.1
MQSFITGQLLQAEPFPTTFSKDVDASQQRQKSSSPVLNAPQSATPSPSVASLQQLPVGPRVVPPTTTTAPGGSGSTTASMMLSTPPPQNLDIIRNVDQSLEAAAAKVMSSRSSGGGHLPADQEAPALMKMSTRPPSTRVAARGAGGSLRRRPSDPSGQHAIMQSAHALNSAHHNLNSLGAGLNGKQVVSDATDMIKGFFGNIQKKIVDVFNEDEAEFITAAELRARTRLGAGRAPGTGGSLAGRGGNTPGSSMGSSSSSRGGGGGCSRNANSTSANLSCTTTSSVNTGGPSGRVGSASTSSSSRSANTMAAPAGSKKTSLRSDSSTSGSAGAGEASQQPKSDGQASTSSSSATTSSLPKQADAIQQAEQTQRSSSAAQSTTTTSNIVGGDGSTEPPRGAALFDPMPQARSVAQNLTTAAASMTNTFFATSGGAAPAQQSMPGEQSLRGQDSTSRRRNNSAASKKQEMVLDKSLHMWREAVVEVGANVRDLKVSERVTYDLHRCLICGTEIEFMCEGQLVKSLRVGSKVWSPSQQDWVDSANSIVQQKPLPILECLQLLVSTQGEHIQIGGGGGGSQQQDQVQDQLTQAGADHDAGNVTSRSTDSTTTSNTTASKMDGHVPGGGNTSPRRASTTSSICSTTTAANNVSNPAAPQSLEQAMAITNQRPIFRRNRRAWDWPLSRECYRMRFVEVLKSECSALAEERDTVVNEYSDLSAERDSLAAKLDSIHGALGMK